ncbi:MAG: cytochrome P450 [Kofleriaceae bacterium]|nr:cytochrome P450 [Kofleriaceae bacterium]MCB9573354.1 cytochrome P450 [Kofleriaceae bacterium]
MHPAPSSPAAAPVPGPVRFGELRGLPVVGKLLDFRRDRLGLHDECARTGDIVRFPMLTRHVYCISSPELVPALLVDNQDAFVKAPGLATYGRALLGDGLLTAEGDRHRRERKLLAPAFAPKRIAAYGDVMAGLTERMAASWRDGQGLDVAAEMMHLTLAIVGRTLFDADIGGDAAVVGEALTEGMEFMIDRLSLPLPMTWPLPSNKRMAAAVARLDDVVFRIIAERRAAPGDRGDVMSMLLEARDDDGGGMTDRDVRDEIMTLMLAGHETTANALAWTWYLLSQHPTAYDRLCAEVDQVLGGRTPTVADLPRLPWALQVIEEAMRLYPPAYVTARMATRPVRIGPVEVQPREVVMVTIRGIHRRPDLWPEPAVFRPDRFTEAAKRARPRYHYMPFGAGPRICIGNHFALQEAHLIVATLAQRWRFRLMQPADIEPEPLVTLRPRGGVHVEAIARRPAARA